MNLFDFYIYSPQRHSSGLIACHPTRSFFNFEIRKDFDSFDVISYL